MPFGKLKESNSPCVCGCGLKANSGKWVVGHWNRGRVHSEEWNRKTGDAARGRKQSQDTLEKRVATRKSTAQKMGYHHSPETRSLIRRRMMEKQGRDHLSEEEYIREVKFYQKMYAVSLKLNQRCVRALGHRKQNRTIDELGYTPLELASHLEKLWEPGMTWENYGRGRDRWNIDHVRPVSSFPIGTAPSIVNALSNLKPMWHVENSRKNSKWDGGS